MRSWDLLRVRGGTLSLDTRDTIEPTGPQEHATQGDGSPVLIGVRGAGRPPNCLLTRRPPGGPDTALRGLLMDGARPRGCRAGSNPPGIGVRDVMMTAGAVYDITSAVRADEVSSGWVASYRPA